VGTAVQSHYSIKVKAMMKLESAKAIDANYDKGVKDGLKLGIDTMCDMRNIMLAKIRDLIESENPDLALALIDDVLG
jgi:hypothetical protein